MPIITQIRCTPVPAELEQPLSIEIALRVRSAGPITFLFAIDEALPYLIATGGKQVREVSFTRMFRSAGDHTAQFTLALVNSVQPALHPSVIITAAGVDGSSVPFTMDLNIR